ncbi:hypothetical protein STEG23_022704, partial [Scotinomys teguina]
MGCVWGTRSWPRICAGRSPPPPRSGSGRSAESGRRGFLFSSSPCPLRVAALELWVARQAIESLSEFVVVFCFIDKITIFKVTTLVNTNSKGPSNKKRGRSKKAHVLAASVEQATENFLEKGDKIAKESQFLKEELVAAVEDVRKQ